MCAHTRVGTSRVYQRVCCARSAASPELWCAHKKNGKVDRRWKRLLRKAETSTTRVRTALERPGRESIPPAEIGLEIFDHGCMTKELHQVSHHDSSCNSKRAGYRFCFAGSVEYTIASSRSGVCAVHCITTGLPICCNQPLSFNPYQPKHQRTSNNQAKMRTLYNTRSVAGNLLVLWHVARTVVELL